MKENKTKAILAVIGGIVVVAGAIAAIIHFWEDIKKKLPQCKCECEDCCEDLAEEAEEALEELEEEVVDFVEFEEA